MSYDPLEVKIYVYIIEELYIKFPFWILTVPNYHTYTIRSIIVWYKVPDIYKRTLFLKAEKLLEEIMQGIHFHIY